MPNIPREEQFFLDALLNPRFQWIARDPDGSLNFYEQEPRFDPSENGWVADGFALYNMQQREFMKHMFKNIRPSTKWKMEHLTGGVDERGAYAERYK